MSAFEVAQRCNSLTLQLLAREQFGQVCSIPFRAPPLECHDKGLQTRLAPNATSPRVVHNNMRVWICATHMGGILGQKFSKQ